MAEVETMTPEELQNLQKEIDEANKNIVSDEVQKKIELAKQKAREEAEKEFTVNQKIKELEKEKEELVKKQQEKEIENARRLEELTKKVNDSISSRAVAPSGSPFTDPTPSTPGDTIENMSQDQVDQIERESFDALIKRTK